MLRGTCRDGRVVDAPAPGLTAGGLHVGNVETSLATGGYDEQRAAQVLAFLAPLPVADVHLLPFHQYGEPKYSLLEREWTMAGVKAPEEAEIALIKAMVERAGYRVVVGG